MYIERFLETFTNEALRDLEQDARNGTLTYEDPARCLLGHHQYGYNDVRRTLARARWACQTEGEFWHCGAVDEERRNHILPLIAAEWERRRKPAPVAPVEEEQLVAV